MRKTGVFTVCWMPMQAYWWALIAYFVIYAGDHIKCSLIWGFCEMFLGIQDPRIPVLYASAHTPCPRPGEGTRLQGFPDQVHHLWGKPKGIWQVVRLTTVDTLFRPTVLMTQRPKPGFLSLGRANVMMETMSFAISMSLNQISIQLISKIISIVTTNV